MAEKAAYTVFRDEQVMNYGRSQFAKRFFILLLIQGPIKRLFRAITDVNEL
jgi:hypothetical protein